MYGIETGDSTCRYWVSLILLLYYYKGAGPGYGLLALDNHDVTNESYRGGQNTIKHKAEQYGMPWNMVYQKISPSERYQKGKSNSHRALHHVPFLHRKTGKPNTHCRCPPSCLSHHSPPQTGRPHPRCPSCCQKHDWVLHMCSLPGRAGMC